MSDTDNSSQDTPITQSDEFSAELDCDRMDFKELHDKQFGVMVSTGDRNDCKGLCSTLHGPYSFFDMVAVVGKTWTEQQHHMKPYVLNTNIKEKTQWLDQGTVDYIEANYDRMILVGVLEEELFGPDDEDDIVVKAGVVEDEVNFFDKEEE